MDVTRALTALAGGFLMIIGMVATASADQSSPDFDARTSRSTHLYLSNSSEAPHERTKMGKQRRIRLRYDRPLQVGRSDFVLRFKAPLKKKKLLAFEVLF